MTKNKLGSLALAFVIALGLWMYVTAYVSTEYTNTIYNIPVALEGKTILADRQLMLLRDEDFLVNVKLTGSRQDVSKINSGNIQVVADLSGIDEAGTHNLRYTVIYPGDVPSGAVSSQKDPDWLTLTVANKKTKQIPVELVYEGDVPADYIKDTAAVELNHPYVEISGPEHVVDEIHHACITIDCEGVTDTIYESYRYELQNEKNEPVDAGWITTNVSEVKVYLPVSMVKKIPLTVTLVDGGGATEATTKVVIEPEQISVSGNETALSTLTELNLGTIDLSQITEDTVREFAITLPAGIRNVSNLPTAKVSISFPLLATREFTITGFHPLNLAEGMAWEPLTQQLTITVRGLKSEVQRLNAEDILVQVDLSQVENTSAVEPIITFPAGLPSLGEVGTYSISVLVTPETDPAEG
jgi:YbbR domain-containing protein